MRTSILKQYLPKKLFGRTILIFLFPIVLIEAVVFIAFIQRHFEQVTSQMSNIFAYQVKYPMLYPLDKVFHRPHFCPDNFALNTQCQDPCGIEKELHGEELQP